MLAAGLMPPATRPSEPAAKIGCSARKRLSTPARSTPPPRAYGRLYAGLASGGRKARGKRALDLLIAATALAAELALYARNPSDFDDLDTLVEAATV